MLIGSNEENGARRLGISAETVERIMKNRLRDEQNIDPERTIKHIGLDQISLKKRHKLYATVMTDLTDPNAPKVPAEQIGARSWVAADKAFFDETTILPACTTPILANLGQDAWPVQAVRRITGWRIVPVTAPWLVRRTLDERVNPSIAKKCDATRLVPWSFTFFAT